MKYKTAFIVIAIIMVLALTACFAEGNPMENVPDDLGQTAGFLKGLWHGIIAPFTFFVSLFTDGIHMYEVHNNGGWYNFGFVIGAGIIFSGGGRASKLKKSS